MSRMKGDPTTLSISKPSSHNRVSSALSPTSRSAGERRMGGCGGCSKAVWSTLRVLSIDESAAANLFAANWSAGNGIEPTRSKFLVMSTPELSALGDCRRVGITSFQKVHDSRSADVTGITRARQFFTGLQASPPNQNFRDGSSSMIRSRSSGLPTGRCTYLEVVAVNLDRLHGCNLANELRNTRRGLSSEPTNVVDLHHGIRTQAVRYDSANPGGRETMRQRLTAVPRRRCCSRRPCPIAGRR